MSPPEIRTGSLSLRNPRIDLDLEAVLARRYLAAALLLFAVAATIALVVLLRTLQVEEEEEQARIGFEPIAFTDIAGWSDDDHAKAFTALLRSCRKKSAKDTPQAEACAAAVDLAAAGVVTREAARTFFETHFAPFRVVQDIKPGLVTGYYEPEVDGSRTKKGRFQTPVYARPKDLVAVRPDEFRAKYNGELTSMRETPDGLVPFYTREEIEKGALKGRDLEILYLDEPVELFFMQIQGSGRVRLPDGSRVRLGYASKNGHPYTSIGKALVARGEGTPKSMTMDGIKNWIKADADRGKRLMWENKSYVFFEERKGASALDGPVGAQGVALTDGRTLAVDPSYHALGTPIFVVAEKLKDEEKKPFRRLMIAQDVGSAIKGPERGDIYWGSGDKAGDIAGSTMAKAVFIVLKPSGAPAS